MEFERADGTVRGRQSQTWVRMPEGWRIVAAHVSLLPAGAAMTRAAVESRRAASARSPRPRTKS